MTSKERANFRSMANTIQPILQIGKNGISDNFIKQVDEALEARELIKITLLETAGETAKDLANEIAKSVKAEVIQVIGSKFVLYRKSNKK
jgi:RNA-binding protein